MLLALCPAACRLLDGSQATEVLFTPPAEVQALITRAHALFGEDEFAQACALYQQAIDIHASAYQAHQGLILSAQARGGLAELEARYHRQVKLHPREPGWHFGLALVAWLRQEQSQAVSACIEAEKLDYRSPEVAFLKGTIMLYHRHSRAVGAAEEQFRRVIELDPTFARAYFNLALLAQERHGDKKRAAQLASQALAHFGSHQKLEKLSAHVFLGRLYEEAERLEEACQQYQEAKDIDMMKAYGQVDVGRLEVSLGKCEREDVNRERALALAEMGWDSPVGLEILRDMKAEEDKLLDYTNLLPGADAPSYATLTGEVGLPEPVESSAVPQTLAKHLSPLNIVVRLVETDLDGDGHEETVLVEARQFKIGERFLLMKPVLHIFSSEGNSLLDCALGYEHFWDLAIRDLNADGIKELVATGIEGANKFSLNVITKFDTTFAPVFGISTSCWSPLSGMLVCDLEDDDKYEVVCVGGTDEWIDVYGWEGDGFVKKNASYPQFYTWYVKKMEADYNAWRRQDLDVARHLAEAKAILAGQAKKSGESDAEDSPAAQAP